jgi:D-proline reductase (dithiol) PrdB
VGLIARAVEAGGIPTVTVSLARDLTEAVGAPRSVFVKWPLGHPLGEADAPLQQRTVIFNALRLLQEATQPGVIMDLDYRWRRHTYTEPDWSVLM